jgi:hypothetical protein
VTTPTTSLKKSSRGLASQIVSHAKNSTGNHPTIVMLKSSSYSVVVERRAVCHETDPESGLQAEPSAATNCKYVSMLTI